MPIGYSGNIRLTEVQEKDQERELFKDVLFLYFLFCVLFKLILGLLVSNDQL